MVPGHQKQKSVWNSLNIVIVYSRPKGEPSTEEPIIGGQGEKKKRGGGERSVSLWGPFKDSNITTFH